MAKNKITVVRYERASSKDKLEAEISIEVRRPKGIKISKKVFEQAIHYKLNSPGFKDPRGFKLRIISWTNPTRNPKVINPRNGRPLNAPRSYGPDRERWETLRGPLLQADIPVEKTKTVSKTRKRGASK